MAARESLPLFRRILGDAFDALPGALRAVHDGSPERVLHGRCRIERGTTFFSRCLGAIASLPPAGADVPIRVVIRAGGAGERWTRHFGQRRLSSSLVERGGLLQERMGLMVFRFALVAGKDSIDWRLARVLALGIVPLPLAWFRGVAARESAVHPDMDSRYAFDVRAALPVAGLLVHYRGELDLRADH